MVETSLRVCPAGKGSSPAPARAPLWRRERRNRQQVRRLFPFLTSYLTVPRHAPSGPGHNQEHVTGNTAVAMLLNLGTDFASPHAALAPLPPGGWALPTSTVSSPSWLSHHSSVASLSSSGRRRRTRPNSALAPTLLHPSGGGPEGVPSSLFKFQPRMSPKKYPQANKAGAGSRVVAASAIAEGESLYAGLVEDSDLPDVSALLVEVFEPGVVLADGEFSKLEGVVLGAPLGMTNNYMKAVAYNEILYSLKSRCGKRLERGDFDRSSDAVVLAVRDRSSTSANPAPVAPQDGGGGARSGSAGEIVAVVELTIRQPDGSLPYNWPFPAPWRRAKPPQKWQPYMGNLAVAEKYRGNGYGKQLVRLCEHVAKNHWGYERMYLHVDMGDPAATGLYSSMGYKSIEKYDAPVWMRKVLQLPTIRYQVKHFKGIKGAKSSSAAAGAAGETKSQA